MKIIYRHRDEYLIRLQRGEELVAEVLKFCEAEGVKAAWVQGLGAGEDIEISYYDLEKREYVRATFEEEYEILNLTGNISIVNGKPFLHAHATFGRKDMGAFGGHVHSLKVSGTGEVFIRKLEGEFRREFDEETGLNVLA